MEKYDRVAVEPGMFRSPLALASGIFLALGSLAGLGSTLYLLDSGYLTVLREKILQSGIRTYSALTVWTLVHIAISIVCFAGPAVTLWGMLRCLRGNYARGLNFLSNAADWALKLVHLTSALALAVFLFRAGRYFLWLIGRYDWLYQLFASFVMEGLMVVQAVFLYRMLCKFLDACDGAAASIGCTLSSGYLASGSLPAFAATGLTVLGILGIVLSVDRMVTMTIASDGLKQYYTFLISAHPGQWLSAAALLFGGIGDLLLSGYLRFYNRTSERALFYASRRK
jgi:hypothetical protein